MENLYDPLLFDDELSSEQEAALRERFEEDPALAEAWTRWRGVRSHLHERLNAVVSDRRLLVMYVLNQEGDEDALTAREQTALDAVRDDIARSVNTIPALQHIVERIREERADFEEIWSMHSDALDEEVPAGAASSGERGQRVDRAPMRSRSANGATASRWTRRFAVAALLVGLAVVGGLLFWPEAPATTTLTVEEGDVHVVDFEDGSSVRLVGAARFSYPTELSDDASVRHVTLETGRAYFDVQRRREDRSFVVETPAATATVLGTKFGVTAHADTTEVVLASGSLRVDPVDEMEGDGVVLDPGQRSGVRAGRAPSSPTSVDLTEALDWTGLLVFRSTSLEVIVDRLRQRFDVQITVAEPLKSELITGTFEREQPVPQVLRALSATLGAEVEKVEEQHYRLVPGS